jgi:hypothetical protein
MRLFDISYQSAFTDTSFLWAASHHTPLECCFSERRLVSFLCLVRCDTIDREQWHANIPHFFEHAMQGGLIDHRAD